MMNFFWESLTLPLLESIQAKNIIEIGALSGDHTEPLLNYCMSNNGVLETIDPSPGFNWEEMVAQSNGQFRFHQKTSLEILPYMSQPDAVIIDGDHNWYTVKHELDCLHENFMTNKSRPCLVLFHDTHWPYGRRDCYYVPERIPSEHRKEYIKQGILPNNSNTLATGGFNKGQFNATKEGGNHNGVLTAIEDFLSEHNDQYEFVSFPVLFGYGVLMPRVLLTSFPKLNHILFDELKLTPMMKSFMKMTEAALVNEFIEHQKTREQHLKCVKQNIVTKPKISIVLIIYNMCREAPRTLKSLFPDYQIDISSDEYEVIVVENGSDKPLPTEFVESLPGNFQYVLISPEQASSSPAAAVNIGLSNASGTIFGVMIDGARIATPGLLSYVLKAGKLYDRPIIFGTSFLLGPKIQNISVEEGYNQEKEDQLLSSINWPEDGYRLFEIGTLAGSNSGGWFNANMESNALFVSKEMWRELGGMDERFNLKGGGFVNPDLYSRACELIDSHLIVIAGEGTFHQVHGGIATNSTRKELQLKSEPWKEQYKSIRGKDFSWPKKKSTVLGHLPESAKPHIHTLNK